VTVGANGWWLVRSRLATFEHALAKQLTVNAPFVVKQRLAFRDLVPLYQLGITVAAGASLRYVAAVDLRVRVFCGQDVVVTMTVGTSRRIRVTASNCFAVNAVGIGLENRHFKAGSLRQLPFQMASSAFNPLSVSWVRQLSWVNVVVTICATQLSVNGIAKGFFVNINASLAPANIKAVDVGIAVTFLTSLNLLLSRQFNLRARCSNTLPPNHRQKPTNQ
jgi:hypothetical protein